MNHCMRQLSRAGSGTIPIALAIVLGLAFTLAACGDKTQGGDARRLIPAAPRFAAVVPSAERLRGRFLTFVDRIEGAAGIVDLIRGRYGLDLSSAEAMDDAGIDTSTPVVLFATQGAAVLAVGLSHPEVFIARASDQLVAAAGATPLRTDDAQPTTDDRSPRRFTGPGETPAWYATVGATDDHIGVLIIGRDAHAELFSTLSAGDSAFLKTPDGQAMTPTTAGSGSKSAPIAYAFARPQWPGLPSSLGLARGVIQSALDQLPVIRGQVVLDDKRLSLRLDLPATTPDQLPLHYLRAGGDAGPRPDAFAEIFPLSTALFLRFQAGVGRLRSLPAFLRDRLLPKTIPGTRGLPLPPLSELITFVDGDFAVAVLGINDAIAVQQLLFVARRPQLAYTALHLGFAATTSAPELALESFGKVATQKRAEGWRVAKIQPRAKFRGFSFQRDGAHYHVLVGRGVVVMLTGAGEVDRFLAVSEGRALPLSRRAETHAAVAPVVGEVTGEVAPPQVGLALGFTRITRQLAAKGVPPYFLKIVGDLKSVTAAVSLDTLGISFALEVAL